MDGQGGDAAVAAPVETPSEGAAGAAVATAAAAATAATAAAAATAATAATAAQAESASEAVTAQQEGSGEPGAEMEAREEISVAPNSTSTDIVPVDAPVASPSRGSRREGVTKLVATHNFSKSEEEDLAFSKGDILYGLELEDMWWRGTNADGSEEGMFPANRVKVLLNTPARPARSQSQNQQPNAPETSAVALEAPRLEAPVVETPALTDVDIESQKEYAEVPQNESESAQVLRSGSSQIASAFLRGIDVKHAIIRSMEEQKVHTTLVVALRALQVLLTFISFICVSSSGVDFYNPFPSIKFVIAMGVLTWLYSCIALGLRVMEMRELGPSKVYLHPQRHKFVMWADLFFLSMNLIATINCGASSFYPSAEQRLVVTAGNVTASKSYYTSASNASVSTGVVFFMFTIFLHIASIALNARDQVIVAFSARVTEKLKEEVGGASSPAQGQRFSEWMQKEAGGESSEDRV